MVQMEIHAADVHAKAIQLHGILRLTLAFMVCE
jgi:hypothetical protein